MSQPRHSNRKLTWPQLLVLLLIIAAGLVYNSLRPAGDGVPVASAPTPRPVATATPIIDQPAQATIPPTIDAPQTGDAAGFDFYVLSLSWSPDYCASSGANDPQQCSLGKKLGFVLHGLWPQYNRGYPSDCSTQKLPPEVKAKFPGLYPSSKLYDHEWEKHGTCSGLSPEQYLSLSKKLKDTLVIPDLYRAPEKPVRVTSAQLKQDFVAANPGLSESALAVNCSGSGRFLQELFVCFSPNGQPTACSDEVQRNGAKSCRNPDFLVRNVR